MARRVRPSDSYDVDYPKGHVIFSCIDNFVWASWPGAVSMVRVGGYEAVTAAMREFLAQGELGERLANGTPRTTSARSR